MHKDKFCWSMRPLSRCSATAVEELLALNVDALVPEPRRDNHAQHRNAYVHQPERRAMASGLQVDAQRKDGSLFPVEISLSPNPFDDAFTVIALVRDITERRRAETQLEAHRAQLVSSARLASLGVMAGGIAHEINNPLAIIHASADELVRSAKQEGVVPLDTVVRNGERIQQTARRITRIIKSMRLLVAKAPTIRFVRRLYPGLWRRTGVMQGALQTPFGESAIA